MPEQTGFAPNSNFAQTVKNMGMDRPEVPAEAYDDFRNHYFNKRIAPRLPVAEREKQREKFLQRTQRPKLPTGEYLKSLAEIASTSFESAVKRPAGMVLGGPLQWQAEAAENREKQLKEELRWRGQSRGTTTASFAGGVGGFMATMPAAEGRVVEAGETGVKIISKVPALEPLLRVSMKPALRRSLAFGALQGAGADPGQHVSDFVKGTAWGVLGELIAPGLAGLWKFYKGRKQLPSPKEVDDFVKEMARGEVSDKQVAKDLDVALAEDVTEKAKKPGYLDKLKVDINDKYKQLSAVFVDAEGREFESPLHAGNPEKAYAQLKEAIEGATLGQPGAKPARYLARIQGDEFDVEYINDLLTKLKQNYEPWSTIPTQIATDSASKGIDAGGGTARVDNKVLKYRYAPQMPSREDARRFIKSAISYPEEVSTNVVKDKWNSRVEGLMREFDTAWNPHGNWMARSEAAAKLESLGLTDIIPTPEVRAKWKPSEGMNLPKIFNEKGWYEALDSYKMRTAEAELQTLDLRQKEHLTSAMKVLWDPSIPHNSPMFKSALRSLTQFELNEFLPGRISREEVAALLNETRVGTETEAKAIARLEQARKEPQAATREGYYQRVGRLAEVLAKQKDPDLKHYYEQYGREQVDAAMNMAGLMWQRSKGDILNVKWDEALIKQGIDEGYLPAVDSAIEATDVESLRRASLESRVLRLAEQYNVDPKNIDRELLEEVGETEVERAREIANAAKQKGVSVYDTSVREEARRLGIIGEEEPAFAPKGIPPSELPSREPGEASGLPVRSIRFLDGKVGQFAYSVRREASGLPSRIYLMFNDEINKRLSWSGTHSTGKAITRELGANRLDAVAADLRALADLHGIDLDKALVSIVHRPNIGFEKELSAPNVWHEDFHGMLSQLGLIKATEGRSSLRTSVGLVSSLLKDVHDRLPTETQATWAAFAQALKSRYGSIYGKEALAEEGFVHAATAIRHGDVGTIAHFGAVDTDVEHVYEAVQAIAGELRSVAGEMVPGASKNFIMDRLGFLEGISSVDRYKAIRNAAEQMFADLGADPETIMARASAKRYKDYKSLFSAGEEALEGRAFAPNYTAWAEAAGARHAIYPTQMPPGRTPPPMPETGIEDGWRFVGSATLWEKIAPTFSWINWVDKKLNEKFGVKGTYLPLADRAKAVDEAYRAGGAWLNENQESALQFLEGGKKKLETYGFMLTKPLSQWGALAQKMELTNDDLARLKLAQGWLSRLQEDTGVQVHNYLQDIQPRLARSNYDPSRVFPAPAKGSSMSTFHRLITTGELNPRDLHLGRLVKVFLREGMEKRFTGEALKEFQKLIDARVDGKYALGTLRAPLVRYSEYMRGIPDNNGKMINRFVTDLQGGINDVIERVNKHLPEGYKASKIDWATSGGDLVRKAILLNYISSLGLRPAIAIRDGLQGISLSLPIMGTSFIKGIAAAVTKEHWALADEAGVLLRGKNVGEVFGDVYQELTPGKGGLANKAIDHASALLAPSRWGHNFARRIVFAGAYEESLPMIKALRKLDKLDAASAQKFLDKTGLWFADQSRQRQLLSLVRDKYVDPKEVAKQVGLELLDLTLWPYRRGTQPGFLKTGIGRVFGQYGLWPMSFLDYVRRLGSKIQENPKKALPALATFLAVNYSLVHEARKHMGVDVSKWFMFSPAGFAGGPALEKVLDMGRSLEETAEGRQARKRMLETPLEFVPSFNEFRALEETWDKPWIDEEGHITRDGYKAMGFRMFQPGEPTFDQVIDGDITSEKWLEYESGTTKTEYRKAGEAVKKAYEKVTK